MSMSLETSHPGKKYIAEMGKIETAHYTNSPKGTVPPAEVAEYSAELLENLRDLANDAGLTFLAYLIQVAVEEAKIQAAGDEHR